MKPTFTMKEREWNALSHDGKKAMAEMVSVASKLKCSCPIVGGNVSDPNCPFHGKKATDAFRITHPWYTPQVEQAHQILLDAADNLDTTERRLAHGELAQALSNLFALRVRLQAAEELLTGAMGVKK